MKEVYLLLGSNEGDRNKNFEKAEALIARRCGKVLRKSSLYETEAWGLKEQNNFLNCALQITTSLLPRELLTELKAIETEVGRTETVKWGPRIIDIDILFYGNETIELPDLKIPHPFLHKRKFTLVPLNEVAGELVHSVLKKKVKELLDECGDESEVKKLAE